MTFALQRGQNREVASPGSHTSGPVRRLGSAIGLVMITLLDLMALDDITTAGAWMPEFAFLIASIPALITLGYFTFRRTAPRGDPGGSDASAGH